MQISLTEEMRRFIEDQMRSGRFAAPEDVVLAGLAALRRQQSLQQWEYGDLEAVFPGLSQKIEAGFRALRAGDFSDGDAFFEEFDHEERTDASRKTA